MASAAPSLRSLAFATYRRALKAGAVHFSETEVHNLSHDGINYQIRYAPNLLKKPVANLAADRPPPPKANPFLPPDAALYISPVQDTHYVVLNKFPVHPGHFILATADFRHQNHPLATSDLSAILAVLKNWNTDIPSDDNDAPDEARLQNCLYGFFNSGANSGASQPHRHVQFLPVTVDEMTSLWPTRLFGDEDDGVAVGTVADVEVRWQRKVSYKHYFAGIPADCTATRLHEIYATLLSLAAHTLSHPTVPSSAIVEEVNATRCNTAGRSDGSIYEGLSADEPVAFSYNLAFSKDWIGILPRTQETVYVVDKDADSGVVVDGVAIKCPGLNLNGTVLAGMMLVRTRREMDAVLADSAIVARALAGIGVPQENAQRSSL
ncbi:hypothetical protein Dda_5241 [Drechslerella dactyloides]|uniref:5',5'''-P-1,P-4-tetraphosphate phosphorylase 2 n=1 Tax=Drechslerella dactyloides TaxID=74499 RepID=A0AAD6IVW5_DREDA|nr:hypothetical protein Dda_5241 [Drechslerella dactyloides]